MKDGSYEVVQNATGWVVRRADRTALVEFPSESQAIRAAAAVCRDEGQLRLVIRRSDGGVEELDPWQLSFDTLEA